MAAIAACSAYGPVGRRSVRARSTSGSAWPIAPRSQRARSWASSRTSSPPGPTRAARREWCRSMSASRPGRLGLVRQQHVDHAREADRLGGEVVAHERVARRRGVALVEHEVEHGEDGAGGGPASASGGGSASGMPDRRTFFFARTSRCATVASGRSSARAISGTVRPPTSRRVSGTCASSASAGWQQANTRPSRSSGIISGSSPGRSRTASSSSRASSACFSRRDASRRSRSIARRFAVVRIHAAGADGTPSRGQRSSATA